MSILTKTAALVCVFWALAACGDDSKAKEDLGADLAANACTMAGGNCIGIEEGCFAGNANSKLGCGYLCCIPAPACTFSCDGGSDCPCSSSEQSQSCALPPDPSSPVVVCSCQEVAGGFTWMCVTA